jgi:NADPH-dependent curcumin reductase CurA
MIDAATRSHVEIPMAVRGPREALIKVGTLSVDPTIRGWMNDAPGHLPPIGVGEVVRSSGVGEVVDSQSPYYKVGDKVFGFPNWPEWVIADEKNKLSVLATGTGLEHAPETLNLLFSGGNHGKTLVVVDDTVKLD